MLRGVVGVHGKPRKLLRGVQVGVCPVKHPVKKMLRGIAVVLLVGSKTNEGMPSPTPQVQLLALVRGQVSVRISASDLELVSGPIDSHNFSPPL